MNIFLNSGPYCIVGVVLLLSGCGSFPRTQGSQPTVSSPTAVSGSASSIGAYPIGTAVAGLDPETGTPATVKVLRAYDSASGSACRDYVVVAGSVDGRQGLACETDGVWQVVAPLVSAQGYAPAAGPTR